VTGLQPCNICDDKGWVCGVHPLRPAVIFSDSVNACKCGGAAVPCKSCNVHEADHTHDAIRDDFLGAFDKIDWRL
jgi:hypothetical protein